MKNVLYAILALSMLLPWMSPLTAQNTSNKRIVIQQEVRQADGTTVLETTVIDGESAEDFDLDEFLEENGDNVESLDIDINTGQSNGIVIERTTTTTTTRSCDKKTSCKSTCQQKGFLGVSPMHDKADRDGSVVSIIKNSAADQAGLERGDRIVALNNERIDDFDDISDFMRETKAGDKIVIQFERNRQLRTVSIAVGSRNNRSMNFDFDEDDLMDKAEEWFMKMPKKNCEDNVSVNDEKEACLGVYSTAGERNGIEGSRITGFTSRSAARDAGLEEDDLIINVNNVEVEGHSSLWNALAEYRADEVVQVDYIRDGERNSRSVKLNPCNETPSNRRFNQAPREPRAPREAQVPQERYEEQRVVKEVIVIRKADNAGDRNDEAMPFTQNDRSLDLRTYRAFPNPTDGLVTIEFEALAQPLTVSLYDLGGKQLFSEEVNSFGGFYNRQFDLSAYEATQVVVAVQQGDRVFTEQVVVSND